VSIHANALYVRSLHDRLRPDEIGLLTARLDRTIPIGSDEVDALFCDIDDTLLDEFVERLAPAHQRCELFVPVRFPEPVAWGGIHIGSVPLLLEDLEGLRVELELDTPLAERRRTGAAQRRLWKLWRRAAKDALRTGRIVELIRL
jgi:hypothetical protein